MFYTPENIKKVHNIFQIGCIYIPLSVKRCIFKRVRLHPKRTTRPAINEQKMKDKNANASAKSKEVQLHPQPDTQLHHICFCPTALGISTIMLLINTKI